MNQHLALLKAPGKLACVRAIHNEQLLAGRTWLDIKNAVHNINQTERRKLQNLNSAALLKK